MAKTGKKRKIGRLSKNSLAWSGRLRLQSVAFAGTLGGGGLGRCRVGRRLAGDHLRTTCVVAIAQLFSLFAQASENYHGTSLESPSLYVVSVSARARARQAGPTGLWDLPQCLKIS